MLMLLSHLLRLLYLLKNSLEFLLKKIVVATQMVIATMVIVPNEHEMEKKVLKFSCHKEFGVGINRRHPIAQNRHFFSVAKSIKYRLRNR